MDPINGSDGNGNESKTDCHALTLFEEYSHRNCEVARALEDIGEARRCEEEEYAKLCQEHGDLKRQLDQLKDKSRVAAAEQDAFLKDTEGLVRKLEELKVQDRIMVERVKVLHSDGFDEELARNTEKLLFRATDIKMQRCHETQYLKGVAYKGSTAGVPLLQPTTGLSPCEVADSLWNLVSIPFKAL
ncbi:kinetochore protein Spc24 [Ixodes scapularis]